MHDFIIHHWDFNGPCPTQINYHASERPTDAIFNIDLHQPHWFHCERNHDELRPWLLEQSVPSAIIDSLLADDTRPRFEEFSDKIFLIILRGVNLNRNAEPDDMLSVRMLWYKGSLITTRKIPSKAIANIHRQLTNENGPQNIAELMIQIIKGINHYISDYLDTIEDDLIDEHESTQHSHEELSHTQHRLLRLRRYLKPQKYVIEDLLSADLIQLQKHTFQLKNSLDTSIRINESVEFYLQQLDLIFNNLNQQQTEKMNRNTYLLSIIAGVFLPAGFFTGLLGVNIGGIPGVDNPWAFSLFCVSLLCMMLVEYIIFKKMRFI